MLGIFVLIGLLCFAFSDPLPDPSGDPPISVIHFYNEKTLSYDIYIENTGPDSYTIELGFEKLSGLRPSVPFPLRKTIEPGRHLVMRLTQRDLETQGSFKVSLSYRRGQLKYKLDEKYPYLTPLREGDVARLVCQDSLISFYSPFSSASKKSVNPVSDFQVYGFYLESNDTIYAARRGIVSKIQRFHADSSLHDIGLGHYLDIQHADGTYGRYDGIQTDSLFVMLGEAIEAGDPVAKVRSSDADTTFFSFQLFYYDDKVVTDNIGPANTKLVNLPVAFQGASSTSCAHNYEVVHPKETIIREMSKRELRRWARKKTKGKDGRFFNQD